MQPRAKSEYPLSQWTDEALFDYEDHLLYDQEKAEHDTWDMRDEVLWEMNRRGLCSRRVK